MDREPEVNDLGNFLSEFNQESDRGSALLAASRIEELLGELLDAYLMDIPGKKELLHGPMAPLGTLSARISMTYSLGLIQSGEADEANAIRKVRNEFAHSWQGKTFEEGKIREICLGLPWHGPEDLGDGKKNNPRSRFNAAVAILLLGLLWRRRLVLKEKITPRNWPNTGRWDL